MFENFTGRGDRTRRVWSQLGGGSPVPAPGQPGEQTSADGPAPVTDSEQPETRGVTLIICQHGVM